MQNSCISTFLQGFEETRTIYTKKEALKAFMGRDTEDVILNFLIHFYKDFNVQKEHKMIKEANLFLKVLNYYIITFKE